MTASPNRSVPIIPTIIVGAAVAMMIALGMWQLQRRAEKADLLAQYAKAATLPEMAFPAIPTDRALLFRRASALCLEVVSITVAPGRSARGQGGWRHIAQCRTGAEGPGLAVDIGWSARFDAKPVWKGGAISGIISSQPDTRSVIARSWTAPPPLMLIARTPAPSLSPSRPPSTTDVPNDHWAYAIQWFAFAAVASVVYVLALRVRGRAKSGQAA